MKCDKAAVSFSSKNRRITQEKRRFLGGSVYDFCDIPLFFEAEALKNLVHMLVVVGKLEALVQLRGAEVARDRLILFEHLAEGLLLLPRAHGAALHAVPSDNYPYRLRFRAD